MDYTDDQTLTSFAFIQKLKGLGIKLAPNIKMRIEAGPIVTGYFYTLDNSVPLSKIMGKAEDFALAAGVESVNIQRVGSEIAIFAANKNHKEVDFKQVLHFMLTDEGAKNAIIPIPLGVDYTGKLSYLDLVDCPHLLLAGATGSGKSVFEAAVLATICISKTSKDLHIYTVDTKQMDLPLFQDMPQIQQTCTNLMEYLQTMTDILKMHEKRALKIRSAGLRSILEYNKMVGKDNKIPHILILIDEFADLIGYDKDARKDKEHPANEFQRADLLLQRIAQVGRATGIHCIAATQRTSVKIINGDIKANFPCRISLRLPTEADSRTILGTGGAENLLGKGDMLAQFPDSEILKRFHGPFVKHDDIVQVLVNHNEIRRQYENVRLTT